MISKKSIEELQLILKEEFYKDVSFEEAAEIASGLVGYFDLLAKLHHRIQKKEDS